MSTIILRVCLLLVLGGAGLEWAAANECTLITDQRLGGHFDGHEVLAALPNPCPADVSPCECSCEYNSTSVVLMLKCVDLKGGEDLKAVFAKFGALKTLTTLKVFMSTLGSLPQDTFNGVTFREMEFLNAGLTNDGGSFLTSKGTLRSIKIIENSFEPFEWPLSEDFSVFTSLDFLFMHGPYKGPKKPLNFPGLTTLSLSISEMDSVDDTTFNSLSKLENLFLMETKIDTLPANVFRDLKNLQALRVANSALTTLSPDSLRIVADNLDTIDLSANQILHVNPEAFNVTNENVNIDLSRNQIAALKQNEIEPLVINYGSVKVEGNPFDCDCDDDIVWIIDAHSDPAVEEVEGAFDQCSFPDDVDSEVLKDFYKYQCSPIPPAP